MKFQVPPLDLEEIAIIKTSLSFCVDFTDSEGLRKIKSALNKVSQAEELNNNELPTFENLATMFKPSKS